MCIICILSQLCTRENVTQYVLPQARRQALSATSWGETSTSFLRPFGGAGQGPEAQRNAGQLGRGGFWHITGRG